MDKAPSPANLKMATPRLPPLVLAIGCSTGGPMALTDLFKSLSGRIEIPLVITQHIASGFSAGLAQSLSQVLGVPVLEGKDELPLLPKRGYLAPSGSHLTVAKGSAGLVCRLSDDPPEHFCKPSVNPMMRSVAEHFGPRALAVILTGIGRDGLEGCRDVKARGGRLIAQDQSTSAVWGMPRAVAEAGLCDAVLPLPVIGESIVKMCRVC